MLKTADQLLPRHLTPTTEHKSHVKHTPSAEQTAVHNKTSHSYHIEIHSISSSIISLRIKHAKDTVSV